MGYGASGVSCLCPRINSFFFSANQLVLFTAENVNASEFPSTNLKSHQINSEESRICGYFDFTGKNSQQKVDSFDFIFLLKVTAYDAVKEK